ncbi:MAG: hypothetical protein O2967_14205, partial [Proteobacteria bacterium]|nr:hypothetical protein [Pseudomonadota bacterium]
GRKSPGIRLAVAVCSAYGVLLTAGGLWQVAICLIMGIWLATTPDSWFGGDFGLSLAWSEKKCR